MRTRSSAASSIRLEEALLAQLRIRPQTAGELERAAASAHSVIARRLQLMGEAGTIHFRLNPFGVTGQRPPRVWFIGPGPEAPPDPSDQPQQILTKAAPVGAQRDPLVAALFGPPSNAPRCTHCLVQQGAGHTTECGVARYV